MQRLVIIGIVALLLGFPAVGVVSAVVPAELDIHPLFAEITLRTHEELTDTVERTVVDRDGDGEVTLAEAEVYFGRQLETLFDPPHYPFTLDRQRATENVEAWEVVGLIGPVTQTGPIVLWSYLRVNWDPEEADSHVIELEPRERNAPGTLGTIDLEVIAPSRWHIITANGAAVGAGSVTIKDLDLDAGLVLELERVGTEPFVGQGWLVTLGMGVLVVVMVAAAAGLFWIMVRSRREGPRDPTTETRQDDDPR